jgi:hypothetical protein
MKPSKLVTFAALACIVPALGGAFVACSSTNAANPGPTTFDSGTPNNPDTGTPNQDSGPPGNQDSGPPIDGNLPDVGNCASDSAVCNSCYTPAQNPLNGCSPAAVNCIPFDNTRVPDGAP